MEKVVIIGSGLGGLTCGYILARNGFSVTILEKNAQTGGCLQTFVRRGAKFETGMHYIGSIGDGQLLHRFFAYLNLLPDVKFSPLDASAYDVISIAGQRFPYANGQEKFTDTLSEYFPKERDNLRRYWQAINEATESSPLHTLRPSNEPIILNPAHVKQSFDSFLDHITENETLKLVLAGNLPLYAGERSKTPMYIPAFINDFYNSSACRIVGGSEVIAQSLIKSIQSMGGTVRALADVVKINCDGRQATSVLLRNGETVQGDYFISNTHPARLVEMLDTQMIRKSYRERMMRLENTVSNFTVYIQFKKDTVPYFNSNLYHYDTQADVWMGGAYNPKKWPSNFLYMHLCSSADQRFAETAVLISYMNYDEVSRWEGTKVGCRGTEYADFKRDRSERLLASLEKQMPGTLSGIAHYYSSSPLTYRDYTGTERGSMYGVLRDCNQSIHSLVSQRTRIPNLFQTGQNVNSHGTLGVIIGSIISCGEIFGVNNIIEEINRTEGNRREPEVNRREAEVNRREVEASTKPTPKPAVIIIGGGIGGLFCGAILSKEGYPVRIFEQHATIGGGLHHFRREGVEFETGMHVIGTFQQGGTLNKLCSYLGIMDQLSIRPTDDDCFEFFQIGSDNRSYRYAKGRDRFIETLAADFPEERSNIERYVQAMYNIVKEAKHYNLEMGDFSIQHSPDFMISVGDFIDSFTENKKLRAVLALANPLYGGGQYSTPAYIHSIISVLYIDGAARFVGGSQQLADVLVDLIKRQGGEVFTRRGVSRIEIRDKAVEYVETADGERHTADWYISAIHPSAMFQLMDISKIQRSYWQRIDSIPNSYSAFTLYIIFKPESFPYLNYTCYYIDDYSQVWQHGDPAGEFPSGMMYLTPPVTSDDQFAQKMIVNCIMSFDAVRQWENTSVGRRGAEYKAFKAQCEEKIMAKLEKIYPDIRACIQSIYSASPLTIRDFYNQKEGSLYGVKKDCNNIMLSYIPVRSKLKNLLLSGQNVNLHGIVGTPLTAINTCAELVGLEYLLNEINKY